MSRTRVTPIILAMGGTLVATGLFCLYGAFFPTDFLAVFVGTERALMVDSPSKLLGMFASFMVPAGAVLCWYGLPRLKSG